MSPFSHPQCALLLLLHAFLLICTSLTSPYMYIFSVTHLVMFVLQRIALLIGLLYSLGYTPPPPCEPVCASRVPRHIAPGSRLYKIVSYMLLSSIALFPVMF